jgi:hypothetical protein
MGSSMSQNAYCRDNFIFFFLLHSIHTNSWTYPPSYCDHFTPRKRRLLSLGVKQLGCEVHHSLGSRMVELYLHPPVCLHGMVLN